MILRRMMDTMLFRALVNDARLTASDIRVYMYLYLFGHHRASIREHSKRSHIPRETLRRSAQNLLNWGWVDDRIDVEGHEWKVSSWMPRDVEQMMADELNHRRNKVPYAGEWLMKCMLDLMVADHDVFDNARPSWLVAGTGMGRLELDRWYHSAQVAIEFQGDPPVGRFLAAAAHRWTATSGFRLTCESHPNVRVGVLAAQRSRHAVWLLARTPLLGQHRTSSSPEP